MKRPEWLAAAVASCVLPALLAGPFLAGQSPPAQPAIAVDPIEAILTAFKSHAVVALSEGEHGNEQGYAFRLALIRDPRFAATVNDLVLEGGNARYQSLMDRFVRGEEIPDSQFREIWRQAMEPGVAGDRPIYADFVRNVRAVNASLPEARRLRVLIGDPPVDWTAVHRPADLIPALEASDARFPAELIQREVLAKGRRALAVYGSGHLMRRNIARNYAPENKIVSVLENGASPIKVFSVWASELGVDLNTLQPDTASWKVPSLAMLRGTTLGAADFTFYWPFKGPRVSVQDGKRTPVPPDQWRSLRMEEQFDALLYLGPPSGLTISRLPRSLCADPEYMKMRLGRLALFGMQDRIDGLKRYCSEP